MVLNQKPYQQHLWKIQTTRAGSFHVKWTKAGHDPTQIWMKLFQMKGMYEIRLFWKFQHKLRTCSKVMAPQSCHGKFKIDQNKRGVAAWVHFRVSITFFVHNLKFWNLLHCCCVGRTLKWDFEIFWKFIMTWYK